MSYRNIFTKRLDEIEGDFAMEQILQGKVPTGHSRLVVILDVENVVFYVPVGTFVYEGQGYCLKNGISYSEWLRNDFTIIELSDADKEEIARYVFDNHPDQNIAEQAVLRAYTKGDLAWLLGLYMRLSEERGEI